MPVTYTIDSEAKTIRTVCSAPLKYDDVIGHFRTLSADPACAGSLDVLLDLSQADSLPATSQVGNVKAKIHALHWKVQFQACAIIAPGDAMFGMMRMFEALAGNYFGVIHVFRDAADAEAWLASQRK